jgi:hypothetical protein
MGWEYSLYQSLFVKDIFAAGEARCQRRVYTTACIKIFSCRLVVTAGTSKVLDRYPGNL